MTKKPSTTVKLLKGYFVSVKSSDFSETVSV